MVRADYLRSVRFVRVITLPMAWVYSFVLRIRHWLYDVGVLHSEQSPVPAVILGNLELGGTGKSPHVAAIIEQFCQKNKLGVLSRGYGRSSNSSVLVQAQSSAADVGDELLMLKRRFPEVIMLAHADRVEGLKMLSDMGCVWVLLDDAYQHRRLAGGLRILLTPWAQPFWTSHLVPAGRRRDLRSRWTSADVIIASRSEENTQWSWPKELLDSPAVLLKTKMKFGEFYSIQDCTAISGKSAFISFCGIADDASFLAELERRGEVLEHLRFKDHHVYTQKDMDMLRTQLELHAQVNPILVTTEKDAVKLDAHLLKGLTLYVLPMRVVRDDDFRELIQAIEEYVRANRGDR